MPARLLSEAQRPTHVGEEDVRVASKKGVRSPSPYDKSESRKGKSRGEKDSNVESAEEDELSDGSASPSSSTLPRLGARRSGSLKRKSSKSESLTQTSKRSRPLRDSAAASTQVSWAVIAVGFTVSLTFCTTHCRLGPRLHVCLPHCRKMSKSQPKTM